jgi:putative transposase
VRQCVANGFFTHRAQGRRKPKPGLLHHSDRGSQTASHDYRQHLAVMKMAQSMSRKGNCWDNSPTERFFRSLKHEQLNYERFRTKASAKLSVIDVWLFTTENDLIQN